MLPCCGVYPSALAASWLPAETHKHEDWLGEIAPLAEEQTDGDVPHHAWHAPAVAIPHLSEFGQERTAVRLIELDLLRVWVAEAITPSL